ncbi:MAG: riboflavin biosynthesis protein RibD [Ectothiorhodospiraceae bacterium]|nr:riboflavin biosynthesis protein RibD [Ectothiorhodospiraceae bacterium]
MRKLFAFNMMTLDGYFEDAEQGIGWHAVEPEFDEFALDMLWSIDTILLGRKTYEGMAAYWPAADDQPREMIDMMNNHEKVVFSSTLSGTDWNNACVESGSAQEEIARLKQAAGKSIALFGSAELANSLLPSGLIDEYWIMLHPVVLGAGTPLFGGINAPQQLTLRHCFQYQTGNVLLKYEVSG